MKNSQDTIKKAQEDQKKAQEMVRIVKECVRELGVCDQIRAVNDEVIVDSEEQHLPHLSQASRGTKSSTHHAKKYFHRARSKIVYKESCAMVNL